MQERVRSFLLGTMGDQARERLEDEMFSNDEVYEDIQDSLNDLLDEYARGELAEEDRKRVEDRLLVSPRNRARLRLSFALALRETPGSNHWRGEEKRRPSLKLLAVASIAAVAFAAVIWLAVDNVRLRQQLSANRSAGQIAASQPRIASLTLQPGLVRGAGAIPQLSIPAASQLVDVQLPTEEVYTTYAIEVEAASRGRIWTQDALARQSSGTVAIWLPPQLLTPGSYEFLLYGIRAGARELLGSYPCRLELSVGESPINTKPAQ